MREATISYAGSIAAVVHTTCYLKCFHFIAYVPLVFGLQKSCCTCLQTFIYFSSLLIWLGTRQQLAKLSEADKMLQIDNAILKPSTVVRNLGVLLSELLSMDTNAQQCAKTCFFHLRLIRQLRHHVDYETFYMLDMRSCCHCLPAALS